jgi:hypothetical protein
MRRRSVLRALVGTAGLTALAGCNALTGGAGRSAAGTPETGSSAAGAGTAASGSGSGAEGSDATATPRPYRAADAPALDRPRGVHLRNLASTERFLTLVVTAGDGTAGEEVLAESTPVPPGETVSFPGLLASGGQYGVLVETADGARASYDWAVRAELDDLWVDLTPAVSFRRPVLCPPDCDFAVGAPERSAAYEVPADLSVAEALGRAPALALDTAAEGTRRATLKIWHRGQLLFASDYEFPPDVRALVPVFPASQRYDIMLTTDAGEAIYDWQPSVRNTLYASLADAPSFRCGYADHDLRVRNETGSARRVTVRVLTGEETLFERTVAVDADAVETVPAAVDPAGPLRFEVATDDGVTERYNWVRCAPNGPITVAVSDDGVYVSVQPMRESS